MMNFFLRVQAGLLGTEDLNKIRQGTMIERLAGQELLATTFNALSWRQAKVSSYQNFNEDFPVGSES